MYCYLWHEKDKPNECKFGERWVFDGQDPETEIWKRIKSSVGVRKDLITDGTIELIDKWDVTELSKKVNRYYQRSRMDDYIRPYIGFRKGSTGEIHELSASEVRLRVNNYLKKSNQPLPLVGLTRNQASAAEETLDRIQLGDRIFLAELCARFGKTIFSGVLIKETEIKLTVVVSYVLTSFASFEKDLSGFEQFKDYVLIDTADPDYQEVISLALAQNKQVVAFLSMCAGGRRQDKINFLFGQAQQRLVIVDEADYGVHQQGQVLPLQTAIGSDDILFLMTGTNSDKAVSTWVPDHFLSVMYPELVIEKKLKSKDTTTKLKHFDVNPKRHELVVDIELYQMDLKSAVDLTLEQNPNLNRDELASWSKFAAKPLKAKGLWTNILQSVFEGRHGLDNLNIDLQTNSVPEQRVAMMFLPGSIGITNGDLTLVSRMAKDALKGYSIITVSGEEMENRTAEAKVIEEIDKARRNNQNVLILSAGMAQRSFSVGQITELYLAYDAGDAGATIQKISRALTPHNESKIGRIVSLSFDPNRDDKFDDLILVTAENYQKRHNKDIRQALAEVLKTLDIFNCTDSGSVKVLRDEYLEQLIDNGRLSRVIGKISDLSKLTAAEIQALAAGNADVYRAAKAAAAAVGKTRNGTAGSNGSSSQKSAPLKTLAEAKKMITTLVENLDILTYGSNSVTIQEAIAKISKDELKQQEVKKHFGIDFEIINDLFERNIINTNMVRLLEKDSA